MKKSLFLLILPILIFANCSSNSDEKKIQIIMGEINSLQDKQELITKAMLGKPNIFSNENINNFPNNRTKLEPTAKEQIDLANQIIELDKEQIKKLREVENLRFDKNFIEYSKLNRQIFEKRLVSKESSVQQFQLILDLNITTKEQLEKSISAIKQKESEIDSEIKQLESQKLQIRKSADK